MIKEKTDLPEKIKSNAKLSETEDNSYLFNLLDNDSKQAAFKLAEFLNNLDSDKSSDRIYDETLLKIQNTKYPIAKQH